MILDQNESDKLDKIRSNNVVSVIVSMNINLRKEEQRGVKQPITAVCGNCCRLMLEY